MKNIKEIVKEMVNQDYAKTLWGPRTTGSTSLLGLSDFPDDVVLKEVEGDNPSCKYYQTEIPGLGGRLGATTLENVDLDKVRVRNGRHGLEFYVEGELGESTEMVTFIIGEDEGKPALFTWHPGNSIKSANLSEDMAVKLL